MKSFKTNILGMNIDPNRGIDISIEYLKSIIEKQHLYLIENQDEFFIYTMYGNSLILSHVCELDIYTYICTVKAEGFVDFPILKKKRKSRIENIIKELNNE